MAIKSLRYFLVPMLLWLMAGSTLILLTDKQALHIAINGYHHASTDLLFSYLTYMGDGVFAGFIVLLGFIYKFRYGVIGLLGIAGSGIITQLLKRQVFHDLHRPSKVFEGISDMHFVEGVRLHSNFTFPSGHATVAFSIFLFLAMIAKRPGLQLICFISAVLVAFSRVYISQHFFEDILAGSTIGTALMLIAYTLLHQKQWGEKGIVQLIANR